MNNFKKKGFTLVELVIVIAVVAILAAVLIPTFSSIIGKANLSADQSAVRNMNTALATSKISDGVIDNPSEAREALADFGFDSSDLVPTSYNHRFYWNKTYNVVLLVDCTNTDESMWTVIFPTNGYDEAIAEFNNIETRYETNFNLADLPNADVDPLPLETINNFICVNGDITELPLKTGLTFTALETPEESRKATYKDWIVDFVITVDKNLLDITANGAKIYLAGEYGTWGWIVIDVSDLEIAGGTPNNLLKSFSEPFTYEAICTNVKIFNCAVGIVGEPGIDFSINLKLVMYETPENYANDHIDHIIYDYTYKYVANVDNQQ